VAITATCRRTRSAASSGQAFHLLGPAVVDRHVLALDIAGFFEALAKSAQSPGNRFGRSDLQKSDDRHRRFLPVRSQRPRRRRAAEKRDELAPLHWAPHATDHRFKSSIPRSMVVPNAGNGRSRTDLLEPREAHEP
jgi:hypothetical protein